MNAEISINRQLCVLNTIFSIKKTTSQGRFSLHLLCCGLLLSPEGHYTGRWSAVPAPAFSTSRWTGYQQVLFGVSLNIESMVTPVFATLIFDDIIGLLKSIRRLNRATMSSAPDEPQKNYTASDEPFRYTGSSTGRSAVCIINDQYSQNQISDCLSYLLLRDL
ncbi:TPA: hypothetical protein VJI18_003789 [Salmonella enterica subsp. salamae serovar 48:z:e,n,x,z15]|nr:hypothetical protein [Salmonella enterica subsp. salamae serovar 48:z:e,n,x,z15]